ncbi:hypothetical protein QBC40DRAFT_258894 [Triangularia verruculosa]|uniref:Uncharacterized protein n=1 Tax=Triangularia verruculosa TaxID=2587418 RepID=A0AAN7AS22_9PEZI|nr:hypothetical protein QBC40DRAFT_258894 [Triangularia verruculosa]
MDPTLNQELLELLSACKALSPVCSDGDNWNKADWWKNATIPMNTNALESMARLFLANQPDGTAAQFNKKFIEGAKLAFDSFYYIFFQREPKDVAYSDLCYEIWSEFARPYYKKGDSKTILQELKKAELSISRQERQARDKDSPVCEEYKLYYEHRKEFEKLHYERCRQSLRMVIPPGMRVVKMSTLPKGARKDGCEVVEVLVEPDVEKSPSMPMTRSRKRLKM